MTNSTACTGSFRFWIQWSVCLDYRVRKLSGVNMPWVVVVESLGWSGNVKWMQHLHLEWG